MKHTFIDKQIAENYRGGSYLYEIPEMTQQAKIAFFDKLLNLDNFDIAKTKIDYIDENELQSKVIYRKRLKKEEIEKFYFEYEFVMVKAKGYINGKKFSISCHYEKNNVMIKTDVIDEKEYKNLLRKIF